jgi:hypothetical protein
VCCRERYGPTVDWLAFFDTDEYLVPMKSDTWKDVLDDMDARNMKILKMRNLHQAALGVDGVRIMCMFVNVRLRDVSSHTLAAFFNRLQQDQSRCVDPARKKSKLPPEPCVVPRTNETFLRTYNCKFIKPPRPERFDRAMVCAVNDSVRFAHSPSRALLRHSI